MKGGLFFEYLLLWKRQRILTLHKGRIQVLSSYLCLIFEKKSQAYQYQIHPNLTKTSNQDFRRSKIKGLDNQKALITHQQHSDTHILNQKSEFKKDHPHIK